MYEWQVQWVLAPSILGQELLRWKRIQRHDERAYGVHRLVHNMPVSGLGVTLPIQEVKVAIGAFPVSTTP
jgi:hypothetical protein